MDKNIIKNYYSELINNIDLKSLLIDVFIGPNIENEMTSFIYQNTETKTNYPFKILLKTKYSSSYYENISKPEYGATCNCCKQFYDYQVKSDDFKCWACKNGW